MLLLLSAIPNPQSAIGTEGSSLWQIVFISFAVILILLEIIRGWRLGIMRQLMRAVAVLAGYAAAYFGGGLLVPLLRSWLRIPDVFVSAVGGAILAIIVYATIASLGTLLFKRTAQQDSGTKRLAYGLSGALLGICFGGFFVWLILIAVRMAGSIAEAQVQARPKLEGQGPTRHSAPTAVGEGTPSIENLNVDSVTTLLARLKNSVEMGSVGNVVKKTDAMPTGVYQTLNEAGTVLADPETAQRFLSYPGTRALSDHPKIVALRDDPEIAKLIAQGRLLELMRHPRVIEAMNDPTLTEQVRGFDLKNALEYARKK